MCTSCIVFTGVEEVGIAEFCNAAAWRRRRRAINAPVMHTLRIRTPVRADMSMRMPHTCPPLQTRPMTDSLAQQSLEGPQQQPGGGGVWYASEKAPDGSASTLEH